MVGFRETFNIENGNVNSTSHCNDDNVENSAILVRKKYTLKLYGSSYMYMYHVLMSIHVYKSHKMLACHHHLQGLLVSMFSIGGLVGALVAGSKLCV